MIRLEKRIAAPVSRVFRACHDPRDLEAWWWGSMSRDTKAEVDFRVGGDIGVTLPQPNGEPWAFTGAFTEIVPDRRVAYTVAWLADMGYDPVPETVTMEVAANGDGTLLVFEHEAELEEVSATEHAKGWADVLETLRRHLEAEVSA